MAKVVYTAEALEQVDRLPVTIQIRMQEVFVRLANWPNVSGVKPLRKNLKGNWRIRTGDYRVIFGYDKPADTVTVWKIGYRGDIYDD